MALLICEWYQTNHFWLSMSEEWDERENIDDQIIAQLLYYE